MGRRTDTPRAVSQSGTRGRGTVESSSWPAAVLASRRAGMTGGRRSPGRQAEGPARRQEAAAGGGRFVVLEAEHVERAALAAGGPRSADLLALLALRLHGRAGRRPQLAVHHLRGPLLVIRGTVPLPWRLKWWALAPSRVK